MIVGCDKKRVPGEIFEGVTICTTERGMESYPDQPGLVVREATAEEYELSQMAENPGMTLEYAVQARAHYYALGYQFYYEISTD